MTERKFNRGLRKAGEHMFTIEGKNYVYNKANDTVWEVTAEGGIKASVGQTFSTRDKSIKYNY